MHLLFWHIEGVSYKLEVSAYLCLFLYSTSQTSLDKGTQRKTTENELPSLTQCTA